MRNKIGAVTLVVLGAFLTSISLAPAAWADKMEYFETYNYYTASKGEWELELWNDAFTRGRQDTREEHSGHQISLEYGITDRWMAEIYAEWRDNPSGRGFEYTRSKLETRYRLGNYHPNGINVALYAEYEKSHVPSLFNDELEGKIILSRDFGPLNVAANAIIEKDLVSGSHLEFAYAGGVSYPLSKKLLVSLETLVKPADHQVFIIPGLHFPLGKKDYAGVGLSFQTSPAPLNVTFKTFLAHEF